MQHQTTQRAVATTAMARFPTWFGLLLLLCMGALWPSAAFSDPLTASVVVEKSAIGIGQTSDVTITFSEAVTGMNLGNLNVTGATVSNLTTVDNTTFTAMVTPLPGVDHSANVVALMLTGITGTSSGSAGAGTVTSNYFAVDSQRPTAAIVMPVSNLKAGDAPLVTFTFSEAVTGFTTADLTVEKGTFTALSSSDGGITWTATFTPTSGVSDATNVVSLNMAGLADLAGNAGIGSTSSANFTIDTVRPTATVIIARSAFMIDDTAEVTITFSEAVDGFDNADLTITNGTLSGVSTADGRITWRATFTPSANITDMTNVIMLDNAGVTNAAGNTGSGTTHSNNFAIDTMRPTATVVVEKTSLSAGDTSRVTITFSEAVTGFTGADLTIMNTTLSGISTSDGGITWTATLTPASGVSHANNVIVLNMTGVFDLAGNAGSGIVNSNYYAVGAPTITLPASLADGAAGQAYSQTLTATGGTAPYTFSVDTASLPTGLALNGSTLSGTPTSSGTFSFTVTVKDARQFTASRAYSVTVTATTIVINPAAIAGGTVGSAYSQTFTFAGGTAPYSGYAATGLPSGLSITAITPDSMTVSGTPSTAGRFTIVISATDSTAGSPRTVMKTYTLTVAALTPVAISRRISVDAGKQVVVELTEGATGGPFTAAALVSASPVAAGPASISGTQLTFAPDITFEGTATVVFTISNALATSAQTSIYFDVKGRPDPSKDSEVTGLLTAQADSAKRFADTQTQNFNSRLEQLHDEGDRRRNSMAVRLGYSNERKDEAEQRLEDLLGKDPAPEAGGGFAMHNYASEDKKDSQPAQPAIDVDLGKLAIWTGGYVNFGKRDDGKLSLDYTTVGVSGGFDYRLSKSLVAGFGFGYGRDATDIGSNGTESRAHAYSGAVYASYSPLKATFIDALIGGSWLDFSSARFVTPTGNFAEGERDGRQLFGSVTASYEKRSEDWLISPYGRLDFSRSWLGSFTESGSDAYLLKYGSQTVDTLSGIAGLRLEYAVPTGWGVLKPGARVEYVHDFEGSSQVSLGYADIDVLRYGYSTDSSGSDYVTLGASLDASLNNHWTARFDYRTAVGGVGQSHAFGLKVGKNF